MHPGLWVPAFAGTTADLSNGRAMTLPTQGAIDCDVHVAVPDTTLLLPYLDDYWRDQIVNRHIHKTSFHLQSYPPNSPLSCRPDWKPKNGIPGSDLDLLRNHLDAFGARI